MFNYYPDLVWAIDYILLLISLGLAVIVILTALLQSHSWNRRNYHLRNIKKNIQSLARSGQNSMADTCLQLPIKSMEQFLDVATNREAVLFSEPERNLIKECFGESDKIARIQRIARSSRNKWRRIEALLSLGYAQDASSLDIMKEAALDKNGDVAYYSLLALGLIKNIESAKILLELLKKKISSPAKVVSILETFPPAIVDEAAMLLDDANPMVRFWAVNLVAKFRDGRYVKKIEGLTGDTSTDVRAAACGSLGGIGRRESKDVLLKCLKDKSSIVRMNAVRSLSTLAGDETMGEIAGLIKEDSLLVRGAVKTAMAGHIDAALPFIEKILSGDDELAKKEAIEAFEISGYMTKLLKNIISNDSNRKEGAVNLLRSMIKAHAHFGVAAAFADLGRAEREKAMEELQTIDRPFAEHVAKKIRGEIAEL